MSDEDGFRGELRAIVRLLCRTFGPAYWRKLDADREYPSEFFWGLPEAGHLAA